MIKKNKQILENLSLVVGIKIVLEYIRYAVPNTATRALSGASHFIFSFVDGSAR